MAEALTGSSSRQELVDVIRQVRRRWRTKLLLGGGIIVLGGGLARAHARVLGSSGAPLQSIVGDRFPHRVSRRARRCSWPLARASDAPPRDRRPGRSLRRGARAVASGGDAERRGHRRDEW